MWTRVASAAIYCAVASCAYFALDAWSATSSAAPPSPPSRGIHECPHTRAMLPTIGTSYRLSHPQHHLAALATIISPEELELNVLDLGEDGVVCRRTYSRPVGFAMSLVRDDSLYAHVQWFGKNDWIRRVALCH
jgi:hypothetical protein